MQSAYPASTGKYHDSKGLLEHLLQAYGNDGLIHMQETWANFVRCKYQGGEITDFCVQYRAALDSCHVVGIVIQRSVQVLHFVTILDSHFEHWCANKCEQMRRDPDHLPTLDALPRSHKEAMARCDAPKWREAEDRELKMLHKLNVVEFATLPRVRALPSKWAYDIKRNGLFKARFVARGDKQRPGLDYGETFSTMVRPESFRMIMAMVAAQDWEAHVVDVVTAFLHVLLKDEPIMYIRPPRV